MNVVTLEIAAKGAITMTTTNIKTEGVAQAAVFSEEPTAKKKANTAPRKPRVAPEKAKSGKKTTPTRKGAKAAKTAKQAKQAKPAAREGTKAEKVLELLKRPQGATFADLMKATNWQKHSIRGFLSGTVGKKMGLNLESVKTDGKERTYSIKG
jgi:hypothetical protein